MKTKILLVEYDVDFSFVLTDYLHLKGYEVKMVADYKSIVASTNGYNPNLIVITVNFAGSAEAIACCNLSYNKITAGCSVLMLSHGANISELAQACEASDYLDKPFELAAFSDKIEEMLNPIHPAYNLRNQPLHNNYF